MTPILPNPNVVIKKNNDMKKILFILAIALCGAGMLSAQSMKGFVSAGANGGIDASFGMPFMGAATGGDYAVTLEKPYSQLEEVTIDTTVLGGINYDDGYFTFNPVKTTDAGTHHKYFTLNDPQNLDVLATLNLTVLPCGPGETVTDAAGITYNTVAVAGFCWTKENLRTPHDSAASYDDINANGTTYGLLYPWYAAANVEPDGSQDTIHVDGYVQGICPAGWHLPNSEEFDALATVNTRDLNDTNLWVGPHWEDNTNASGFTALPAGKYNGSLDRYEGLGTEAYWWSTTYNKSGAVIITAKVFVCAYYCEAMREAILPIKDKVSIRCVKKF